MENFVPNGYIKGVAFELPREHKYDHAPFVRGAKNPFYGRQPEYDQFLDMLKYAKTKKGVYLVAGYRGMGKTSFVEKVLSDYNNYCKQAELWRRYREHYSKPYITPNGELEQLSLSQKEKIKNTPPRKFTIKKITKKTVQKWTSKEKIRNTPPRKFTIKKIIKKTVQKWTSIKKFLCCLLAKLFDDDSYKSNCKHKKAAEEPIKIIKLYISAPNVTELDLLRQATSQLKNTLKECSKTHARLITCKEHQKNWGLYTTILFIAFWIIPYLFLMVTCNDGILSGCTNTYLIYPLFLIPILCLLTFLNFTYEIISLKKNNKDPYLLIRKLFKRAYATVSKEKNTQFDISGNGILGKLNLFGHRETESYPLATSKELEQELIDILKNIKDLDKKYQKKFFIDGISPEIIFVFDELDKVTLADSQNEKELISNSNDDIDYRVDENRSRRAAVINILGNLKSFLTQADARFIFIAGREMFDASLADVSDRQSLLSSIFNHTIYINSFLKDGAGDGYEHQKGITDIIERYLIGILRSPENADKLFKLKNYYSEEITTSLSDKAAGRKALFTLQKFIVYLTYRSNGSPKKLSRTIENFLKVKDTSDPTFMQYNTIVRPTEQRDHQTDKKRLYLFLSYDDQYRIGFINYLFRPYIINKSSYLKKLSDNTLVTTPYVMDHLIKFHPFAFSIHNLEQIPEVISSNSTQAFRNYVKSLVEYLSLNHIRETHVNLFSYKFISKSENELNYLTLKFEEEAAAFNFTLDESYPVKMQLIRKVKALRASFSNEGANRQIYSLSFLNGWLGDLYFFDQEFDDAINMYSDAIKDITNRKFEELNFRDFSLMINFKLKQGLCFEKMKSYEDAISFYTDAINNTKGFLVYTFTNTKALRVSYPTSVINDLLQVINQCFIAKAYAQEKMSFSGFSTWKAKHNMESFLELVYSVNARVPSNNYLTLANYFLNMGNLVYYKNEHISKGDIKDILSRIPLFNTEHIIKITKNVTKLKRSYERKSSVNFSLLYYLLSLICLKRFYSYEQEEEEKVSNFYRDEFDIDRTDNNILDISLSLKEKYSAVYKKESSLDEVLEVVNDKKCNNRYAKKIHATLLSAIGNCILQTYAIKKHINRTSPITMFERLNEEEYYNEFKAGLKDTNLKNAKGVELVIKLYKLSAEQFGLTGAKISETHQLRKIIYLIRSVMTKSVSSYTTPPAKADELQTLVDKKLLIRLFELNSEIADVSDKKQYQKYKKLMNFKPHGDIADDKAANNHIDESLSNHPKDREIWLLRSHLDLTLTGKIEERHKNIVHQHNSIATQYGRLGELLYEEKYGWVKLEEIREAVTVLRCYELLNIPYKCHLQINSEQKYYVQKELFKIPFKYREALNRGRDRCINHLFACFSIIRISNSLKTNMMISPSLIGYIYFKTALCLEICALALDTKRTNTIYYSLKKALDADEYIMYEPNYFYRKAKMFCERAKSLHTQGKAYEQKINENVYLEDDYNDNSNHFGIALERFYLYSGRVDRIIYKCRHRLAKDKNHVNYDDLSTALEETQKDIVAEARRQGIEI